MLWWPHGLERRHRRWGIWRGGGGAGVGEGDAAAVGAADAGQRDQLHALHAVPAGGRGGDAGAAARGDAAAGHAQADLSAAGLDRQPRSRGARPSSCARKSARSSNFPTTSCCWRWGRCRGCCRCLGLPSMQSASRASPTRSSCATTWSRRWRKRTRQRTRLVATSCSPTSSSAAAMRGWRRWPSCRTSPRTRWRAIRGPACTGCAGSWSRRPTGCCRRSIPSSPTTPCASCVGGESTSGLALRSRRSSADSARLSSGETLPTRTVVWTAGVAPQPALKELSVPLDDRGRVPVDDHLRVAGDGLGLGDRRLRGRARSARRPLPAHRPARGAPGPGRGAKHRRRAGSRLAAGLRVPQRTPPSSISAATRRWAGSATEPSADSPLGGWPGPTT